MENILCIRFNSTNTLFAVGNEKAFRIYNINKHYPLVNRKFEFGVKIIELLDTSNIIGIVGYTTPTVLYIWNEATGSIIGSIDLEKLIIDIKLTKSYVCVIFNDSIKLFRINKLQELKTFEKDPLYTGNIYMTEKHLIYPSNTIGHINIYDIQSEKEIYINAHQNNVSNFGISGNYLSSVSKMGTLIRVFDIETLKIVKEYRRGICNSTLYTCCMSNDNRYLLTTGDTGTIHIYNMIDETQNTKSIFGTIGFILPDYFSSTWSSIKFYDYDHISKQHIACFDPNNSNHIIVCAYDGSMIKYNIDNKNKTLNIYDSISFL